MRAQGVALPILNLAIWLERANDIILDARLAVGPSGQVPRRISAAEEALYGQPFSTNLYKHALAGLLGEVHFRNSPHRASTGYRVHLAGVLLRDSLQAAWQRAG